MFYSLLHAVPLGTYINVIWTIVGNLITSPSWYIDTSVNLNAILYHTVVLCNLMSSATELSYNDTQFRIIYRRIWMMRSSNILECYFFLYTLSLHTKIIYIKINITKTNNFFDWCFTLKESTGVQWRFGIRYVNWCSHAFLWYFILHATRDQTASTFC